MKILLLYPPPGTGAQPYTSLPSLTAFLRREGYTVVQRDIGIEAVEDLLSEARLAQAWDRVTQRLSVLEGQSSMTAAESAEQRTQSCVAVSADYVIHHIDEAKRALRSPSEFYDLDRYIWATNLVKRARELLSAEYYPSSWGDDALLMPRYERWLVSDLLTAIEDESQNIFLAYFRDKVVPSIVAEQPDIIGISITHWGQLISGLTLARLLKAGCPDAHLCAGGAIMYYLKPDLQRNPQVFELVDSIVAGEGEHALLGLAQAVEMGSSLEEVPNLLYLRDGQVQVTHLYMEDMNDLPTLDYGGLPLNLYLTPEVIAPLPTERGCYWDRCAFCSISKGMRRYRPRKIELVLEDMKRISRQVGTRCFFLAGDGMAPARMKALAEAISAKDLELVWQTEARLEKSLTPQVCETLAAGGCRRLMLGLESGAQRVLDLMDKGITAEGAAQVIHNCFDAGISTHLFLMVGFPTETREEARQTLAFVRDHHEAIHSVGYQEFGLFPESKVYKEPERYGIQRITRPPSDSFGRCITDYEMSSGMTLEELTTEMLPESQSFFSRVFRYVRVTPKLLCCDDPVLAPGTNSVLLNYLARFGVRRLEELPHRSTRPIVHPGNGQQLLDMIPHPVSSLSYRALCDGKDVIFNPATGVALMVPPEIRNMLSLCDGRDTVQQMVDRMVETSEGADYVKLYFLCLQFCTQLINRGFLTVAGAKQGEYLRQHADEKKGEA